MKKTMRCPCCGWRLFDFDAEGKAEVVIKCTKCKRIVKMVLDKRVKV